MSFFEHLQPLWGGAPCLLPLWGEVFTNFGSFSSHRGANFLSLTPGRRTVTGPLILIVKPLIQLQENMFFLSSIELQEAYFCCMDTQRHRLVTVRHNSGEGEALSLFSLVIIMIVIIILHIYWYVQRLLRLIWFRELLIHCWSFTTESVMREIFAFF